MDEQNKPGENAQSNVISLDSRRKERKKKEAEQTAEFPPETLHTPHAENLEAIPAKLTWLYCPVCDTLEYTELVMEGGRMHKCGTVVQEQVIDIDVRAEATLALANLERAKIMQAYLDKTRAAFEEYLNRLTLMAGSVPSPYPLTPDVMKHLAVAEIDPFGMMVPEVLHEPRRRFPKPDKEK
ncbi:MAG: hypothetical protein OEV94_03730 [Deltaproteobacteria bacterium]|nr:hypothetical protein [Deltaproteobacteria bacterium]